LNAPRPGEIRNMHQAVHPLFNLDERAEFRHVANPALHYGADAVALFNRGPGIRLQLLKAERDAAFLDVDFQHHGLDLVAGFNHFGGMPHAPRPRHFADMDEAFHARVNLDEGAIIGNADDTAHHFGAIGVAFHYALPRIGQQLFHAKRDALLGRIVFQHYYADFVAYVQHFTRMRDAAIRHVGDM